MFNRQLAKSLKVWKEKPQRKPLILRGARQVGKTTLVTEFSKQFDNYLYLNLEKKGISELFEKSDEIDELIAKISEGSAPEELEAIIKKMGVIKPVQIL